LKPGEVRVRLTGGAPSSTRHVDAIIDSPAGWSDP